MTDQNRKTLRSFYCRDYLWELFEQMAQELGCSMDYLINESMRLYARSRDYSVGDPQEGGGYGQDPGGGGYGGQQPMLNRGAPQQPGLDRGNLGYQEPNMEHRTFDRVPAVGNRNAPQPPQQGYAPQQPQPQQPQQRGPGGPPPPPPRPSSPTAGWQPQHPRPQAPQAPQAPPPPQAPPGFGDPPGYGQTHPQLFLTFNNNRYVVEKDKFIIGRGSQQTDLTIRDGNISRKHCAVIFRNGQYYIKDLDSTNGIEYRGNRIESKKVDEGDVFYLCDYELRFSYRG